MRVEIYPSRFVAPIQLTADCTSFNEKVIAVGNGWTRTDTNKQPPKDHRLRQAQFSTLSMHRCEERLNRDIDLFSVICADPSNGQSISFGDSGKFTHTFLICCRAKIGKSLVRLPHFICFF